jgi:hypothetical protein
MSGAFAWSIVAGLIGAVVGGIVMAPLGPDGTAVGAVMGSLPAGVLTLVIKYPRWDADI